MKYVRRLEEAATSDFGLVGFEAAFLVQLESVTAIASLVAPGCCGPGLHFHTSDQFFFVLEGESRIQLGDDVHTVAAGSLVFIPAGVAHRSWNDGSEPERHLELLVPSVRAGLPLLTPVASVAEAPGSATAPVVVALDREKFAAGARNSGFAVQTLADASSGVASCVVNVAQVGPGGTGPPMHLHTFDQLFFVLEGELQVEVALQRVVAPRHSLVVLPAGVPHTQWNDGPDTEVHLAVLLPGPRPGEPITIPVAMSKVP